MRTRTNSAVHRHDCAAWLRDLSLRALCQPPLPASTPPSRVLDAAALRLQWLATVPPSRSMAEEDGGHIIANHPELAAELEPLAETIAAPAGSLVIWHRLCVASTPRSSLHPPPNALWFEFLCCSLESILNRTERFVSRSEACFWLPIDLTPLVVIECRHHPFLSRSLSRLCTCSGELNSCS